MPDAWGNFAPATYVNSDTTKAHRIRIDYKYPAATGTAQFSLAMVVPGSGVSSLASGNTFVPRFDLPTTSIAKDGSAGSPDVVTYTTYTRPEIGLATAVTVDPAGQALTTSTAYEPAGSGYFRRTSRTLPGGNTSTYAYYGDTEVVANPCNPTESANQAGKLRSSTSPVPAKGAAIKGEVVYNSLLLGSN